LSGDGLAPCTGAIVYDGAYDGPVGEYIKSNVGDFTSSWTGSFVSQGRHLCWALVNQGLSTWTNAQVACANLTTDSRLWRLPNLRELHVLYKAIGGNGGSAVDFTVLDTNGSGVSNGASAMSSRYWSGTESNSGAYSFSFNDGSRGEYGGSLLIRCVRTL
jgi:hypothetical protein